MIEEITAVANLISSILALITAVLAYKLAKKGANKPPPAGQLNYISIIGNMQVVSLVLSLAALIISIIAFINIQRRR